MHSDLAREIHEGNIAAGWWSMGVANRNRPEILMLIVSEVAEASEGHLGDLMDDKLPHLKMFGVELADTAIRLYDVIGADAVDTMPASAHAVVMDELLDLDGVVDADLMLIVRHVARAMEAHRKGRTEVYQRELWLSLQSVYVVADAHGVDLSPIIAEKRVFNAVRPDHKIEARQAAGGKSY